MRALKARLWATAAAGLLGTLCLLPVSTASASVIPHGGPPGFDQKAFVCANGGAGLCLQANGKDESLVANDNKITSGSNETQQWEWFQTGVTSAKGPFANTTLDKKVAPGRPVGQWEEAKTDSGAALCMAQQNLLIKIVPCAATHVVFTPGTQWVLSGSGRIINVLGSNDTAGNIGPAKDVLEFLNSSGRNGGNPADSTANACPGTCWGPNAG